ncbi:MAG: hypothetical protein WCL39_09245 [Armatimonadota bacterium]
MTDAEECLFGTDPGNSQTIADIPDLWLARYFTNILLASGPSAIDPNAVSNSDGYTIAQMAFLNLDPNATNYPALGKETIINGNFSQPAIGSAPSNTSDPTWDYWGEGGVPGWTAVVGHNIELQNVETTGTNGQYCELKADPANHYGIKQQVRTQKGVTYLLVLDCKARQDTTLANNQFSVNKDGTFLQSVTPTVAWATNAVSFTATKVITEISLVPDNNPNDTMGCLVDNVELIPVGVKTLSFSGDNYYQLTTDDASTAYAAPHWVDLNGDGKASTSQDGERNYPIAYTRNTKPKVAGTFKLNSIPVGCPLKIKATSSHGLQIPETAVYAPIDGTVTLPLTESSTALVNDIKFFNAEDASAFKIDWFIKVADSEWVSIGSTSHTMSITFATPITNERQESLFAVSCMQGQGAGSEAVDIITEKIFAYFKGLDVRQMKPSSGTPMQNSFTQKGMGFYAYGSLNTQDGFTKELLTNGDGRCTGWAHFFKDCLAVHGITSVIEQIIPIYDNQNDYLTGSAFMLIKEFNFLDGSLPTSYLPFTHDNEKEPPEVTKGESIHGQSMVAPPQRIKNHFLVYQNSRVFDPSYGVGPCTLLEWETTAISGYYCKKPLDEDQDGIQDVDSEGKPKFKNIAKKKTPNQLEIEFAQP